MCGVGATESFILTCCPTHTMSDQKTKTHQTHRCLFGNTKKVFHSNLECYSEAKRVLLIAVKYSLADSLARRRPECEVHAIRQTLE